MTFQAFLLKALADMKPIMPAVIVLVVLTAILTVLLSVRAVGLKLDSKTFRRLSVFYDLHIDDCIALAASFVKVVLLVFFMLSRSELTIQHYLIIAIPAAVFICMVNGAKTRLKNAFWIVIELIAAFTAGMVLDFVITFGTTPMYSLIFWLIAVFVSCLAVFIFINELGDISSGRRPLNKL